MATPPKRPSFTCNVWPNFRATCSNTRTASRVTSGPMPSPGNVRMLRFMLAEGGLLQGCVTPPHPLLIAVYSPEVCASQSPIGVGALGRAGKLQALDRGAQIDPRVRLLLGRSHRITLNLAAHARYAGNRLGEGGNEVRR